MYRTPLCIAFLVGTLSAADGDPSFRWTSVDGEHLAYGEIVVPLPDEMAEVAVDPGDFRIVPRSLRTSEGDAIPILYPAIEPMRLGTGAGHAVRFRFPTEGVEGEALDFVYWVHERRDRATCQEHPHQGRDRNLVLEAIGTGDDGDQVADRWRGAFRALLHRRADKYAENEFELLLARRFFGAFPPTERDDWHEHPLFEFLATISGLNDLRDALPEGGRGDLRHQVRDREPPEPLQLPLVKVPNPPDLPDAPVAGLACHVPGDCYFLGFESTGRCTSSLTTVAESFDRWSKGTYPRAATDLVTHQLGRLGLDEEWLRSQGSTATGIAFAGYDPFFQSGTHVLAVIAGPVQVPPSAPFHAVPEAGVTLVATGQGILDHALAAREDGAILADDPAFRAARVRLGKEASEEEHCFLFLSDAWFGRFLSPRWQTLAARRRAVAARLRLIALLRVAIAREHDLESLPGLERAKELSGMEPGDREWLFDGMFERRGRIFHAEHGALHDHVPIDEIALGGVTAREHAAYESFKRNYRNLWRQMDPAALQVVSVPGAEEGRELRARLYLSPIGNRSGFAWLRQSLPPAKKAQPVTRMPGLATGITVTVGGWLAGIIDPEKRGDGSATIQVGAFDFAPPSYAPHTWLDEPPKQDQLSFFRLPAFALLDREVVEGKGPIGDLSWDATPYPGVRVHRRPTEEFFRVDPPRDDSLSALALQPEPLARFARAYEGSEPAPLVSDVHAFVDLDMGHLLRTKLLQLAVRDRTLASWRRDHRYRRIAGYLGHLPRLPVEELAPLREEHVFPWERMPAAMDRGILPTRPGFDRGSGWRTVKRKIGDLPAPLLRAERLDAYVTVEENALEFELRLRLAEIPVEEDRE